MGAGQVIPLLPVSQLYLACWHLLTHCPFKQERIKKNNNKKKNQPHLALKPFNATGSHSAGPLPALWPDQVSETPTLPDPAAGAQIFQPRPIPPCLGITEGWGRNSFSTGWARPILLPKLHCPVSVSPPPKVPPENKGSLRFTGGCACPIPLLAPKSRVWPLLQTQFRSNFP